jgi:predicted nucleotidyltransferase component of viral defense system
MILALTMVENLQLSGLDFIFKGGTSLTLLLGKPKRFSIDIDIVLASQRNLDSFFQSVIDQGAFYRYEENLREGGLPKQHYKFYFHSVIQNKESHILLDILFDEDPYPRLQEVDVNAPILSMEGRITRVSCPLAECLLGDKLTAFAPNTTGIQYGMGKEIEMAKQLFDIGTLFDVVPMLI